MEVVPMTIEGKPVSVEHARCRVYVYWRLSGFAPEDARTQAEAFAAARDRKAAQA